MTKYIITECEDIVVENKKLKNTVKQLINREIKNIQDNTIDEDKELAKNVITELSKLKPYNKDGLKQFNNILGILSKWEGAYNPYELEYKEV